MINILNRKELAKVLGNRYSKKVQGILASKGEKIYSAAFISHVYNGLYENTTIELAIYELYNRKLAEAKKLKTEINRYKKNTPEAGTSGV